MKSMNLKIMVTFVLTSNFNLFCLEHLTIIVTGYKFMRQNYKKLGRHEPEDQTDFAKYLRDNYNYIDGSKIAIWGWVCDICNSISIETFVM